MLAFAVGVGFGIAGSAGATEGARTFRRSVVVDEARIPPALDRDGFVVPIHLVEGAFTHAHAPDGLLRFWDDAGNELPYEIEAWDDGGESWIWLRLAGPDAVWMGYGAGTVSTADPWATWERLDGLGESTTLGVWHLSDGGKGDCTDADDERVLCGQGVDQLYAEASAMGEGLVAGGRSVAGADRLTRISERTTEVITLEMWARLLPDEPSWRDTVVAGEGWAIRRCRHGQLGVNADGWLRCTPLAVREEELWHHVAVVVDSPLAIRTYVDGTLALEHPAPYGWPVPDLTETWFGGASGYDAFGLDGDIDEIRVYGEALPPERIRADAASLRTADGPFATIGPEEVVSSGFDAAFHPPDHTVDRVPPVDEPEDPIRQLVGGGCGCTGAPRGTSRPGAPWLSVGGLAVLGVWGSARRRR